MTPRLLTRVALFSALIYVLSWGTSILPNVNLAFFIVFFAGAVWGLIPGVLIGLIGMALWTALNPFGPAMAPIMMAQAGGMALSGLVGFFFARWRYSDTTGWSLTLALTISAVLCTTLFYLPVNVIDAVLFKPFWPRFYASSVWSLISLGSNIVIFPLLFRALRPIYVKERAKIKL